MRSQLVVTNKLLQIFLPEVIFALQKIFLDGQAQASLP